MWICIFKLKAPVTVLLVQMYRTDTRKKQVTERYVCTNVFIGGQRSDNVKVKYSTRVCADRTV